MIQRGWDNTATYRHNTFLLFFTFTKMPVLIIIVKDYSWFSVTGFPNLANMQMVCPDLAKTLRGYPFCSVFRECCSDRQICNRPKGEFTRTIV